MALTDRALVTTEIFVRHPMLGIGKLHRSTGVVRFFGGPTTEEIAVPADGTTFVPVQLERHQRVWCRRDGLWRAGFVDSLDTSDARYMVDFPNGCTEYVAVSQMYVLRSRSVSDPVDLLKAGTVETRYWHRRRSTFVGDVLRQRVAAQGLAGIWSSGVDIHAHQVGAARRILADPVRRYLLADEVGLGKTVEAGMVLRQLLLDCSGEALVLAPDGLTEQWKAELRSKFRVDQLPGRVLVHPHSHIATLAPVSRMAVIVDEAHRLTAAAPGGDDAAYRQLCAVSHAASSLLLLSATPVRSNEDGFLRMLHLLDPSTYPLDGLAQFRHRVDIRDDLGEALAALGDDAPVMFLAEPIAALRRLLPDEKWLQTELDLLDQLIADRLTDQVRSRCRRVRMQLAETHRIHRRMIRTRRSASLARLFPVRGRTVGPDWLLTDPDERRPEVFTLIEDLRNELAALPEPDAEAVFRTVLGRAMAPVIALADLAAALREEPGHDLDDGERTALQALSGTALGRSAAAQIEAILAHHTAADRFTAMIEWAWLGIGSRRTAVACSFPATAAAAADRLEAQFGAGRVVRLLSTMSVAERSAATRRFVAGPFRGVLVMDRGSEEGINLQVVDEVLHLDLPVSVARIEQRLGRFDRWAQPGRSARAPVRSAAFREQTAVLDANLGGWRLALDEGLSLFGESTATLQYVVPEVERDFLALAIDQGLAEAGKRTGARRDELDRQRRRIEGQDLLDAIEDRTEDTEFAEAMRRADMADRAFAAFRGYAVQMLGFTEDIGDTATRFGISSKHPPRLTESDVTSIGPDNLRRRYAHRRAAATNGVGLLRWGEPLMDRFADLARKDDRGRVFAIEVCQPNREPRSVLVVFMFRVVVAADSEPVDQLRTADPAAARAATVRLGQLFPPLAETVWWRPDHGEPPEQVCRTLDLIEGVNLGSRPERFDELVRLLHWPDLCEQATREALRLAANRPGVLHHTTAAASATEALRTKEEAVVQARLRVGADTASDPRVLEAVAAAVAAPQLAIDSCGVVFLTGPDA
ncbi:protein DpdE [Paractinoplanes rhizophilus]|uniref:Protein DpdE n=1 Tax=Paractinoplanes rhizophilus TaxID=1416877 RepID=A0ABW2I338_9ACTN